MGLAFAFGWTPCISPVLATVLAVAGQNPIPTLDRHLEEFHELHGSLQIAGAVTVVRLHSPRRSRPTPNESRFGISRS